MKTTKREIENIFRNEIEKKISNNGYQLDENNIFRKRHNKDIMWFFSASLWNDRPYSVSSSIGCEYITIDVFAYNKIGINFYEKQGYHPRGIIDIKKIK